MNNHDESSELVATKKPQPKPTLMECWEEFLNEREVAENVIQNMTFDYAKSVIFPQQKTRIGEALVFWYFIRKTVNREKSKKGRHEFINSFLANDNRFIRLVVMIELMPIYVWRRILWRTNIDFMSYESFFRRLEETQMKAIEENYCDCFNHEKPRILTRSEKRKEVPKDEETSLRYLSKAAMSYNLLNLDFGFNAYPNGKNDDTKIVDVSPFRFLSRKNHSDDFVVNEEFGKYYRAYKSARSNYVWNADGMVSLKTHICPGFWYTLIVHFLFWIGSPVLTAFIFTMLSIKGTHFAPAWISIPMIIPAALTPCWLIAAGFKKGFITLAEFIDQHGSGIKDVVCKICESFWKRWGKILQIIENGFMYMLIVIVLLAIVIAMFHGAKFCLGGNLEACIFTPLLILYLGYCIKKARWVTYSTLPMEILIPITAGWQFLFVDLGLKHGKVLDEFFCSFVKGVIMITSDTFAFIIKATPIIMHDLITWFAKVGHSLWWFFSSLFTTWLFFAVKYLAVGLASMGLGILLALIPVGMIVAMVYATVWLTDERITKISYWIERMSKWLLAICIAGIIAIYKFMPSYVSHDGQEGGVSLFGFVAFMLFLIGSIIAAWYLSREKNPEIRMAKIEARELKYYTSGALDYNVFLKNRELKSLNLDSKRAIASRAQDFSRIFETEHLKSQVVSMIMRHAKVLELLDDLEGYEEKFRKIHLSRRYPIFELILKKNLSFKAAVKEYEISRKSFEQKKAFWTKVGHVVARPFVWISNLWKLTDRGVIKTGKFIGRCFYKTVEIAKTLKWFYELFNERCPFKTETKIMD